MAVEQNLKLMRRWFQEVWNEGKMQTIYDLMAPNGIGIGQLENGEALRGPAEFEALVNRLRGGFPDIKIKIEDAFGADDKVVVRWAATMTHFGDIPGKSATGKTVRMTGITITRIADGKIAEGWDNWDQLSMLKQIGAF